MAAARAVPALALEEPLDLGQTASDLLLDRSLGPLGPLGPGPPQGCGNGLALVRVRRQPHTLCGSGGCERVGHLPERAPHAVGNPVLGHGHHLGGLLAGADPKLRAASPCLDYDGPGRLVSRGFGR
jgi:hypothetical protein